MEIRTIKIEELDLFCKDNRNLKEHLIHSFENGTSSPQMCFVATEDSIFTGMLIYGVSSTNTLQIWRLDGAKVNIKETLLMQSITLLKENGYKEIECHLYGIRDKQLFMNLGFSVVQEKLQYIANEKLGLLKDTFIYKTLNEISEERFIEAIMKVTTDTLDQTDQTEIKRLGKKVAATCLFDDLKSIQYKKNWWMLAYDQNNELVGLVIPQQFNETTGAINYIGVVPEKRGNGYGKVLLLKGTKVLQDASCKKVIADIDVNNIPMKKALEELHYVFTSNEYVFKKEL